VVLKVFSKQFKSRYVRETNAYRFLYHYGVPAERVVPQVIGVVPTINKKKLEAMLQDSIPEGLSITLPASGVLLEYIDGSQRASAAVMTPAIAKEALYGLQLIHNAHVLHKDAEARNILIYPDSGRVVWIDFSSAEINRSMLRAVNERKPVKQLLYWELVYAPFPAAKLLTSLDGRNGTSDRRIRRR